MAVKKTRRTRVLGAAAAFVGVGAAGLVMAAPASAAVTSLDITTPSGYGSSQGVYGTGCSYKVEATINNTNPKAVVHYIISDPDGVGKPGTVVPSGTKATFTFAPEKTGKYTIRAGQYDTPDGTGDIKWQEETVKVGKGFQAPSLGSVELPFAGSCLILVP